MTPDIHAFIRDVETALERRSGTLGPDSALNDIGEFDSLGRLALMSMTDARYGVVLKVEDLGGASTLKELWERVAGAESERRT